MTIDAAGKPSQFGRDPRDHVKRSYHSNGQLASEIHYRGVTEHGPWRTWYADGTPKEEFFFEVGAYVNGVNKTWHPNGQLATVMTYVDGKPIHQIKIFELDGTELKTQEPFFKKRFRKRSEPRAGVAVDPLERDRHNSFIASLMSSRRAEARTWLQEDGSRYLGEWSPEDSTKLVEVLYRAGAIEVIAVEVETACNGIETANNMIVRLPSDPIARDLLFQIENAAAEHDGFDGVEDWGQDALYLRLC